MTLPKTIEGIDPWKANAKLLTFVQTIARMTIEGEEIDGQPYLPDGCDDEIDALYELIRKARKLVKENDE